jgi:hypothetical protein
VRLKIGAIYASGDTGDKAKTSIITIITKYSDFTKHLN